MAKISWWYHFLVCIFISTYNTRSYSALLVSVSQLSLSVVSDSLGPHELQHARPPCPSQTPRVHANPCPSSRWCHPAISSSVVPFSSCSQSLPASESFPMSHSPSHVQLVITKLLPLPQGERIHFANIQINKGTSGAKPKSF